MNGTELHYMSAGAEGSPVPGFGIELLADVTHGGAWHMGVLAAPGIPEMLLAGRERTVLSESRSRR